MELLLAAWLILLITESYGRVKIDYTCPSPYCQCATLPDRLDAVQVVCQPPIIRDDIFNISSIPANYTTWLTISCKDDILFSHLTNEDFSHLEHLAELLIINCIIPTIPKDAFSGLRSLRHLNITRQDGSQTPTIPELGFLDPLVNLEVLQIPMAKMQKFPDGFLCPLKDLEHIEMALNDPSVINGFNCNPNQSNVFAWSKVRILNLNENGFGEITQNFHDIVPNVEVLGLASNKISSLPNGTFGGLHHLRSLYLENNPIGEFTEDVFQDLICLEVLNLQNTEISKLDSRMFQNNSRMWLLILSNNQLDDETFHGKHGGILQHTAYLHLLDISFNRISNVFNLFLNTPYLMQLDLGGNAITEIANRTFENVAMLQSLNLTQNPLGEGGLFGDSLFGLQQLNILDLSGCDLGTIPDEIFNETQSLTQLYIARNKLTHLPESLKTSRHLKLLDLNRNRIAEIHKGEFDQMESLNFLKINYNEITYIPKSFLNKNINVQEIYMEGNKIEEIEYGAFEELNNLRILDLSNNKLKDIILVFYLVPKLQYIFLNNNKITSIDKWCFPPSTKALFLQDNRIRSIKPETFSELQQLALVHLERNQLGKVQMGSLQISPMLLYRPEFYLAGNIIACTCHMSWILTINNPNPALPMPYIKDLYKLRCDFEYSREVTWIVEMHDDQYLCEWDVECDQLSCNCCFEQQCSCSYTCPSECKCYRNNDKSLQIVDCARRNLTTIPEIPSIATLVDLDGNDFSAVQALAFQNNSRLRILSLNNSGIETIQDGAFKGLNSLHSLWLNNNRIRKISTGAFVGLNNLKNISLHSNYIETLSETAFDSTQVLNNLTLHGNQLGEIAVENFLTKNAYLTRVTLSENPWSCNCTFGPDFQKWIQTNIQMIKDANDIQCEDDSAQEISTESSVVVMSTNDVNFEDPNIPDGVMYNDTEKQLLHTDFNYCYPNMSKIVRKPSENKRTIIALTVSGCVFLFVLTIALIIYSSREIIKVCLYNRYGFRFNKKDEKRDDKRFDAFVSYSQKDQKFVTKSLVPKLEQEKPYYHLCLHYRDWPIGGSIAQTICESVEQSRRTIILLSENFMKSEWCQYEFKAAHYRVLHDKTIRLIVILLDKPPQNLDPELKLYIKTNTYLEWKDPWFWQKLKYALPEVEREPRPSGRAYYQYLAGKPVNPDPENGKVPDSSDDSEDDATDTDENTKVDENEEDMESENELD